MRYLFFDLEEAQMTKSICEFGYVVTDEDFNIIKKENFIINPNLPRSSWDKYVLGHILTRDISEYEMEYDFKYYYPKIQKLIEESDYVIGHTTSGDVNSLNIECKKYNLPSLDFKFYDVKDFYKVLSKKSNDVGVVNIMMKLNIKGDFYSIHDACTDAYNTMLDLKEILKELNCSLQELIERCPKAVGENEGYRIVTIYKNYLKILEKNEYDENLFKKIIKKIKKYSTRSGNRLINKSIYLSETLKEEHMCESLNLIQFIYDEGGTYENNIQKSNVYIGYRSYDKNGKYIRDKSFQQANVLKRKGQEMDIYSFKRFLNDYGIDIKQLSNIPEALYEKEIILDEEKTRRQIIYSIGDNNEFKLGDKFADLFANIKDGLDD